MKSFISLDLSIIFALIFFYIFLRILINTKHDNAIIVKELFLVGFVISILMILTLSSDFFAFYCFEGNTKDTLLICFLFTFIMQIALLIISHNMISISQIILNIIGGLMGIFISNNFISKTNLRFC